MFAAVSPATKLRFDEFGFAASDGKTVMNDGADGLVTVTFTATAATPVAGTPPRPRTVTSVRESGPRGPEPATRPSIVG